jgi:hypothetical protein
MKEKAAEVIKLITDKYCCDRLQNMYDKKWKKEIPEALKQNRFMCPITLDYFTDPVIAADGFTYDRSAITQYLKTNNTSPLTRKKLKHKNLIPNKLLRFEIQDITGEILNCQEDDSD